MMTKIDELLDDLIKVAASVRSTYADLFDPEVPTIPIPFFGAIESAQVVTIGLNPSDGELRGRNWPASLQPQTLHVRLAQYFSNHAAPPHAWFGTWIEALALIGVSYGSAAAAHVDLCPWATKPMSTLPEQQRFTRLVEESVPWFTRCLRLAVKARLVLLAGAVNKGAYLNEFIRGANAGGLRLEGIPKRQGKAFVCMHTLHLDGRAMPAFFCSVSPSSRTKRLLPLRVAEHRKLLTGHLA